MIKLMAEAKFPTYTHTAAKIFQAAYEAEALEYNRTKPTDAFTVKSWRTEYRIYCKEGEQHFTVQKWCTASLHWQDLSLRFYNLSDFEVELSNNNTQHIAQQFRTMIFDPERPSFTTRLKEIKLKLKPEVTAPPKETKNSSSKLIRID
ncbi:hypothetical protein [Parashewanella tropica]|uniref:hypothetical protein n=1 Tax=Parashewanella tropica TaxID=2547970 RepID=UPI001478E9A8|nr:hypothetical protein [Parashewanella tropica]